MMVALRQAFLGLAATMVALPQAVFAADLRAVFELPRAEREMTIELSEDGRARIQLEEGVYVLIQGEAETYFVNGESVVDLEAFRREIESWALGRYMLQQVGSRTEHIPSPEQLRKTDRTETIAGIEGIVWVAQMQDPDTGEPLRREFVLSDDPRIVKLRAVMRRMGQQSAREIDDPRVQEMREAFRKAFDEDVGFLRYDNRFKVKQVSDVSLSGERFTLPQGNEVKSLPGMGDLMTMTRLMLPFATQ